MNFARLLFLLCLITFLCTSGRAQCPVGLVVLSSDIEVADFFNQFPTCTDFLDDLRLEAGVTDLAPFSRVQSIDGDLLVFSLPIDNIDGLAAIKTVAGDLHLKGMSLDDQLATVPLALQSVGNGLILEDLDQLKLLDALESLQSVGRLAIISNDVLTNIDGIQEITIQNALLITGNTLLSDCANEAICQALDLDPANLFISANTGNCANYFEVQAACLGNPDCPPGLVELSSNQEIDDFEDAYPNCINLPGDLLLNGTARNLTPNGMQTVAGNVTVRGVGGLVDIDRFSLTSVGGDLLFETLSVGPDLANGILPLQTVGGNLSFAGLGSLETVDAFQNVTSLGGLFPGDLIALQDIDGLSGVPVTDLLAIFNLDQFSSLDFLDPLDLDGQTLTTLSIQNNAQLEELSALEGFTVTNDLRIQNNPSLEQCNVGPVCGAIAADISIIQISNNNTGCSSVAEVKTQCFPELTALMAFYTATNGPNWTNNSGWAAAAAGNNCTPCDGTWLGVSCENERVRALSLQDNNLTGGIDIPALSDLQRLSIINLGVNNLTGNIPDQLFDLPNLRILDLEGNDFTGGIPTSIMNATGLRILELNDNENLGGTIPSVITNLVDLVRLDLHNCGLTGVLPNATIGNLTLLSSFNVSLNQLTGQFGGDFGLLTSLQVVIINGNQFSGLLPGIFDLLPNLRVLQVGDNEFTGPLPVSIFQATGLDFLSVAGNNLSGIIGTDINNLTSLRVLDLFDNDFTGAAPRLDQSPTLDYYRISENQFSGPLADDLLSSTFLSYFSVANNQLTGELPEFLVNSSTILTGGQFGNNDFSGCYPASYAALCGVNLTFDGNDQLPLGGDANGFNVEFCQNNEPCAGALPVTWAHFTAEVMEKEVLLSWSVSYQENNAEFVVERLNREEWAALGSIETAPRSGIDTYEFTDETPIVGDNFYRIRQVDVDGQFSFSEVRQVTFDHKAILAWPNPVGKFLTVYAAHPDVVEVYDMNGRKVFQFNHLGGGARVQKMDLRSGVYLLRIKGSNEVQRLIVR